MYKALALCVVMLLLTSCQAAPEETNRDGVKKAQTEIEKMVESTISENNTEQNNKLLIDIPDHYEHSYKGEKNELNINAKIVIPKNVQSVYKYEMSRAMISKKEEWEIARAFWGEKSTELEWNEKAHLYTIPHLESPELKYVYQVRENMFSVSLKGNDYNPYAENLILSEEDFKGKITEQESIRICKEILNKLDKKDYEINNLKMYGKGANHPYRSIEFVLYKDELPVCSKNKTSYIDFNVDDFGVARMVGYNFELVQQEKIDKVIPIDLAVKSLADNIDNIVIYGNDEFVGEKIDNEGNIVVFNVSQITFQYSIRNTLDGKWIVSPSWSFGLQQSTGNVSTSIILAVDAVTGEVIL